MLWLAAGADADPNSAGAAALIPTSPKSIEACFRLGIGELALPASGRHQYQGPCQGYLSFPGENCLDARLRHAASLLLI